MSKNKNYTNYSKQNNQKQTQPKPVEKIQNGVDLNELPVGEELKLEVQEIPEEVFESLDSITVEPKQFTLGKVVNCKKLNIRKEPNKQSQILHVVDVDHNLMIDEANSTSDWYKVKINPEGYCMKEFVELDK